MGKKSLITKEQLELLLVEKTPAAIAKSFSVDPATITYYIKKYGISLKKQTSDDLLVQWIYDNCFSVQGSLNNKIVDQSWWVNRNFLDKQQEIINRTNWLDCDNITQRIYHVVNKIDGIPICKTCGNPVKFKQFKSGYNEYCSLLCATQGEERNAKMTANHDYVEIGKKCKETNLKKFGVEHFFQHDTFQDLARATKLERYGDPNYNNSENNPACQNYKDPEYQKWLRQKKIEKYGTILVHDFGAESKAELELLEFLNTTGYSFSKNRTIFSNFELDAYCEELQLAIEYCGLYWHCELYKNKWYHYKKMDECNKLGIRLITIFEDEWLYRNSQVKEFLNATVGKFNNRIPARKCKFVELDDKPYDFFQQNHIQGRPQNIDRSFGLVYNDELMGCVSYAPHHRNNDMMTLNRLAFKSGVQCIGGASKLIKNSLEIVDHDIVTWSDSRWSNGILYANSGFKLDKIYTPDYSYVVKNRQRKSKQSMKKSNIGCPDNVTEHEFLKQQKIYRIYDCGKKAWIYNKGE